MQVSDYIMIEIAIYFVLKYLHILLMNILTKSPAVYQSPLKIALF